MTIRDVAKAAGVSVATVSRVINHNPAVAAESERKVRTAIESLGYEPPVIRRGPKPRPLYAPGVRTGSIGFVMLGHTPDVLREPLIVHLVDAFRKELSARGMCLILDHLGSGEDLCMSVRDRRVDGVLIAPAHDVPSRKLRPIARSLPTVRVLGVQQETPEIDCVSVQNQSVGYVAFEHLLRQGLTRFAFLSAAKVYHDALVVRGRAFADAARVRGYQGVTLGLVGSGYNSGHYFPEPHLAGETPEALVAALLKTMAPPVGLMVGTDATAVELYPAFRRAGWEPGRDVVVVSVGNFPSILGALHPRPAAVDLQIDKLAALAVARLTCRMAEPSLPAVALFQPPVMHDEEECGL